ncbi:MAG: TerC family protein [Usitatibacter sp.]
MLDPIFWTALAKIIGVNVVLSGDNAVVIALAARTLAPREQKRAIFWGSGAAVALRVILTLFAVALLGLPWVKLIGAVLLLWIGVKLLLPEVSAPEVRPGENTWIAVKTILVADLVMSLDNVIAVAAAAGGDWLLMAIGLAISIPLVIFGASLLVGLMERWPVIVTLGAGLLGYVGGEMAWDDPALASLATHAPEAARYAVALGCAALVIGFGRMLAARPARIPHPAHSERPPGDTAR